MRRSFIARSMLTPLIESWRPVPAVAIVPFFIIWFGFAWHGKLLLVALASMLVVIVGVLEAIDRIDPLYFRVALSFGAKHAKLVDEVLMPAILPPLLASLRIALAIAITVAVVAEFMGATRGLGHVLNVAMNTFATHTVVLCAIVLGLIGSLLDLGLRHIYKRLVPWAKTADEAVQRFVSDKERFPK
jgi:ABC-type nitrate/sulfonate/bicarbonate transport system permease component